MLTMRCSERRRASAVAIDPSRTPSAASCATEDGWPPLLRLVVRRNHARSM